MVSTRQRILVIAIVLGVSCHSPQAEPKPRQNASKAMETTKASDEQAWHAAEQVARRYLEGKGHKIDSVDAMSPHLPYFFVVGLDGERAYCLVSDGKVVESKGLATLGHYLKASGFLQRRDADADSFIELIHHLESYPPDMASRGLYFDPAHPELGPRLEWVGGGARFVLHYSTPPNVAEPHSGGRIQTGRVEIEEWTLSIPADYRLAWKQKIISVPFE
jgi:hypothetical protein